MAETPLGVLISVMRYFFLGIMIYIAVIAAVRSFVEYRQVKSASRFADMNAGISRVNSIRFLAPKALAGEVVELDKRNTIGSDGDCDICVENSALLPLHAELFERNGAYYIITKSRGSADINGSPMGGLAVPIHANDTISLQGICFICEGGAPEIMDE